MRNKHLLLIVEGDLDFQVYGEYFHELTQTTPLDVHVTSGDILTRQTNHHPKQLVEQVFRKHLQRTKLKPEDYQQIIQISDTDGSYVPNAAYRVDSNRRYPRHKTYQYAPEEQLIYSKSETFKEQLQATWKTKRLNQNQLVEVEEVLGVPYRLFYVSLFLEHVLGSPINLDAHLKRDVVEAFLMAHELDQFHHQMQSIHLSDQYHTSWKRLMDRPDFYTPATNIDLAVELVRERLDESVN
ncbi:hypothetical protein [Atopobacter phocae]|uniref:hypothetical protein n=1 Tax=Atopobacter phocae TaxID=136492 RepID=UPI000472B74C|nr:hypothetical protein [Atopobacter phocae]